jgi:hypothetical protein
MKRFYSAVLLSAAILCGQASVSGPPSEYVFDPGTQTIRAIIGTPGSAYLGKSVVAGVHFGSVAPNGLSAIVVSGTVSDLIADLTQSRAPLPLVGAMESPDQILWAQDSSGAVLFSSRAPSLQFVTQINQQPVVHSSVDLRALVSAPISTDGRRDRLSAASMVLLAIDPAAKLAIVAARVLGQSGVYLIQNGLPPELLMSPKSASAAAFGADGSLYVVDGTAGLVWAVRTPSGSPQVQSLPAPQGGLGQPVAVAVEGNQLYVADSAVNQIRVYSLTTLQQIDDLHLDSAPSTLEPFAATSFLVNARRKPADPVLLLQTSPAPSVIFIPSGANQ